MSPTFYALAHILESTKRQRKGASRSWESKYHCQGKAYTSKTIQLYSATYIYRACGSGATEEFTNGDTQLLVFSYVNITKQVEVNVRLSWRISSGPPLTSPTSTSSTIVTTAFTGQPTGATPSTSSPSPSSDDGTTENSQMTSSTSPGAVMTTTAGPTLPPAG